MMLPPDLALFLAQIGLLPPPPARVAQGPVWMPTYPGEPPPF